MIAVLLLAGGLLQVAAGIAVGWSTDLGITHIAFGIYIACDVARRCIA